MKNKLIFPGLVIMCFIITNCHSPKNIAGNVKYYNTMTLNEQQISNYLEKNTIEHIKLIQFYPAPGACGVRAFVSNYIGTDIKNDTIRVLSLCDTTKNVTLGMNYNILRENTPPFGFTYSDDTIKFRGKYRIYFGKLTPAQ